MDTTNLNVPNDITAAVIEEGRKMAYDESVKGYTDMTEQKAALAL